MPRSCDCGQQLTELFDVFAGQCERCRLRSHIDELEAAMLEQLDEEVEPPAPDAAEQVQALVAQIEAVGDEIDRAREAGELGRHDELLHEYTHLTIKRIKLDRVRFHPANAARAFAEREGISLDASRAAFRRALAERWREARAALAQDQT